MTPEGKMKARVDKLLRAAETYCLKPVQNGMGAPALDYHGCHKGQAFFIETKAPGKHPTARQVNTMKKVTAAGGSVLVISDDSDLEELQAWLHLPAAGYVNKKATDCMSSSDSSSAHTHAEA